MTFEMSWLEEPPEVAAAWQAYTECAVENTERMAWLWEAYEYRRREAQCHVEFAWGAVHQLVKGLAYYSMIDLDATAPPRPRPSDGDDVTVWRAYRTEQRRGSNALVGYKFDTNDDWRFTAEQIRTALEQYERAVIDWAPSIPPCCDNNEFRDRWQRLLKFLKGAAEHGGAVVN